MSSQPFAVRNQAAGWEMAAFGRAFPVTQPDLIQLAPSANRHRKLELRATVLVIEDALLRWRLMLEAGRKDSGSGRT
jgi:hypothetical protein